jgi:hypothetical protein
MSKKFEFTTRETYLQYRVEWKAAYAQATIDGRTAKAELRQAAKDFAKVFAVYNHRVHKPGCEEFKNFYAEWDKLSKTENIRAFAKKTARELLEELQEAKVEAERQWHLARQT